jgi:CrcB protein
VTVGYRAWVFLAVAIGGALGTVARYELALAEPVSSGRFPWATLVANIVGSFVLGVVVVVLAETRGSAGALRAFLAVGFCGGLTTFSTWMVESMLLTRDGDGATAALYVVVSLLVGLVSVAVGIGAGRAVVRRPVPVFDPERDD